MEVAQGDERRDRGGRHLRTHQDEGIVDALRCFSGGRSQRAELYAEESSIQSDTNESSGGSASCTAAAAGAAVSRWWPAPGTEHAPLRRAPGAARGAAA